MAMDVGMEDKEKEVYSAWLSACLKALQEGDACPPNPLPNYRD